MNKIIIPIICILFATTSCTNETENDLSAVRDITETTQFLTVSYKGVTFKKIPVKYDQNGDFIFIDDKFSKIYEQEIKNDGYTMFLDSNSQITFYDDLEDFLKDNNLTIIDEQTTRSGYNSAGTYVISTQYEGGVELYDDKNFLDTRKEFLIDTPDTTISIPNLGVSPYNFNDKCSSLRVTNNLPSGNFNMIIINGYTYYTKNIVVLFAGYEDNTYRNREIICVAETGSVCSHKELPGFNDKLTSFKLYLAQKGQYNCNIN